MNTRVDARKQIELAAKRFEARDFTGALTLLNEVLSRDGTNTDALGLHGEIVRARTKEDVRRAAEAEEKALAEPDIRKRAALLKTAATAFRNNQRLEHQLTIAESRRDVLDAMLARAQFHSSRQEREAAARQLDNARDLFGDIPEIRSAQIRLQQTPVPASEQLTRIEPKVRPSRRMLYGVGAAVLLTAVFVSLAWWFTHRTRPPVTNTVAKAPVAAQVRPAVPKVPAEATPAGDPRHVDLRIESSRANEFSIDDGEARPLENGTASIQPVGDGHHKLRLSDGRRDNSIAEFDWTANAPANVSKLEAPRDAALVAVGVSAGTAQLWSNRSKIPVRDNAGKLIGNTMAGQALTLPVSDTTNNVDVVLGDGELTWRLDVPMAQKPTLFVGARTWVPPAILMVTTDQPDVRVSLEGKPVRNFVPRSGEARPLRSTPGKHSLLFEKEWFVPVTYEWNAVGSQTDRFTAHLIPASAVQIQGAAPSVRVVVNGGDFGLTDKAGQLIARNISAGTCTVVLSLPKHVTKTITRECRQGSPLVLSGADVQLTSTHGWVKVSTVPLDAKITVVNASGVETIIGQGVSELPVGKYTRRVTAPGYQAEETPIVVVPGGTNWMEGIVLKKK